MKLRSHLIALVIASLLPVIIFAGVMVYVSYQGQRADINRGMLDTARAISLAVDRELEASIRTLQALGASERLEPRNLKPFYNQAARVLKTQPGWNAIVLFDSDARLVLNLLRPFGSPLPRDPPSDPGIKNTIELKRPLVSNLFSGRVAGEPRLAVNVPVIRNGKVKYVLAATFSPAFLRNILQEQKLSPPWLGTIIDRNGTIIARTRDLEKYIGQPATPTFVAKAREAEEIAWYGVTRDGQEVFAGLHRSALSGWTVGLAVPRSELDAPLRRSLLWVVGGGVALLSFGIALAVVFARRITRPMRLLSHGAEALGRGETPKIQSSSIRELDQVAREIESAAVNRRRIELALRQSEERVRTIIEAEPECVKIVAPDGRLVEVNPAGLAMLDAASMEEVQARPLLDFIGPEYRSAFADLHKRVMEGESGTLEFEAIGLKGTRRWLDTHATPLRDEDGKPVALLGITRDITVRKSAEQQTRRSLERIEALRAIGQAVTSSLDLRSVLRVLLEKIELFLPIATAGTVRLLNRDTGRFGFLACRGVDHNEWNRSRIGAKSRKIVATKTPLAVLNLDADPLTYNREVFRKQGLVSYLGLPLIAKDEVLGVLGIYTNQAHDFGAEEIEFFTALAGQAAIAIHNAQLYEETVKANKVKDEFLSIMSHEMRTPLSVVTGYVGMLKDRLLGEVNPRQEVALQKVFLRAGEQLDMINDVMQTTQLESRLVAVERLPVNLQELFDQLRADYEVRGVKKDVQLVWDYRADAAPLITDRAKLKQVLQNLVNNALKFTDQGTVTISAVVRDSSFVVRRSSDEIRDTNDEIRNTRYVELGVTDTGVGIPKEQIQSVFEKFYQVDSSESRLYEGVGLGLYIVKKFTELLGGQIEVESEVGKGTTFTVRIPCAA